MDCKKGIRYMSAYLDGELSADRTALLKEHLDSCASCRGYLKEMLKLNDLLQDGLPVPPLPDALSERILAEARTRMPSGHQGTAYWIPLQWIYELSAPMKAAAAIAVVLAIVIGISIDGRWLSSGHSDTQAPEGLYGLEWFEPSPPASLGAVYVTLAYEEVGQ